MLGSAVMIFFFFFWKKWFRLSKVVKHIPYEFIFLWKTKGLGKLFNRIKFLCYFKRERSEFIKYITDFPQLLIWTIWTARSQDTSSSWVYTQQWYIYSNSTLHFRYLPLLLKKKLEVIIHLLLLLLLSFHQMSHFSFVSCPRLYLLTSNAIG